jgi:Tfp pilus assembly protein PilN
MKAINLLPPDLRGTPKSVSSKAKTAAVNDEPGGIGAFVVLGALTVCVIALAAYVLTNNAIKDRQAQLDAATSQAQSITQRVAQLKPYADFKAMAETRIQTVKDLASSRFDWEQALRDISRAIPADVTLKTLNGSISSGAGGTSTVRSAITSPAIEITGCTRGQKQVAALLSRLRGVQGVTRVSLTKSTKQADPNTAAAPVLDESGKVVAVGCGKGNPPDFEIVLFFEHSKVPATVQDITVQPAAGAAQPTATGAAAGTTPAEPGAGGVTTPPADPAESGVTPASTPQGGAE